MPLRFGEIAAFAQREVRQIQARSPRSTGWLPAALRPLDAQLAAFEAAAVAWDAFAASSSGGARDRARADGLAGLAIGSLGARGAFGRGCILWGPSESSGCGSAAMPVLDGAVRSGDRGAVAREVDRLSIAFARTRDYLVAGDWVGRGKSAARASRAGPSERN